MPDLRAKGEPREKDVPPPSVRPVIGSLPPNAKGRTVATWQENCQGQIGAIDDRDYTAVMTSFFAGGGVRGGTVIGSTDNNELLL